MAGNKLACGQRHGNTRQHKGHQRCQAEKVFCTFHRLANFRACIAHVFNFFTCLDLRCYPILEIFYLLIFTGHQQSIIDAAAFLHESGCD